MQLPELPSDTSLKPRVFVRKEGGEYVEIPGVESFERQGNAKTGVRISFVVADAQRGIADHPVLNGEDKDVDVKIEFMIGMLMVMQFSGSVESVSSSEVTFSVSGPISTDVLENPTDRLSYH